MGSKITKCEILLRMASMVLATMAALVIGLDAQTKAVMFTEKKATVKALQALWVSTIVYSVLAGYQLVQLCWSLASTRLAGSSSSCSMLVLWICHLLDQGTTYVMFASTVAATQASMVAVTGVKEMQWSKLCNIYTRFCFQIGGGLFCGLVASMGMAVVSSFSARRLFKLYPSYGRISAGRM